MRDIYHQIKALYPNDVVIIKKDNGITNEFVAYDADARNILATLYDDLHPFQVGRYDEVSLCRADVEIVTERFIEQGRRVVIVERK